MPGKEVNILMRTILTTIIINNIDIIKIEWEPCHFTCHLCAGHPLRPEPAQRHTQSPPPSITVSPLDVVVAETPPPPGPEQ